MRSLSRNSRPRFIHKCRTANTDPAPTMVRVGIPALCSFPPPSPRGEAMSGSRAIEIGTDKAILGTMAMTCNTSLLICHGPQRRYRGTQAPLARTSLWLRERLCVLARLHCPRWTRGLPRHCRHRLRHHLLAARVPSRRRSPSNHRRQLGSPLGPESQGFVRC